MKRIVAVTGGIGSGKSVVCRILKSMGYPVYDCDTEAKLLMDSDAEMQQRIAAEITPEAIAKDGRIDRKAIARCVFSNPGKLRKLNEIVHGAVRNHFSAWADKHAAPTLFVETAILYESGFDTLVSEVWEVTAPTEVRIARVQQRNGLDRKEIERRIASQNCEQHPTHHIIVNDGTAALLPQIFSLL